MSDEYTLTVDMATVDSLGRNLYSNAAAVLSEFVANAWDADANNVSIDYKPDEGSGSITITDDGCGMDTDTLNSRFLTVGYQKENGKAMNRSVSTENTWDVRASASCQPSPLPISCRLNPKEKARRPGDSRLTLPDWMKRSKARIQTNANTTRLLSVGTD